MRRWLLFYLFRGTWMSEQHSEDGCESTTLGTTPRAKLLAAQLQRHFSLYVCDPSENQWTYMVNMMTLQIFTTSMLILVCPSETAASYKPEKRFLECAKLARGAGISSHPSAWSSTSGYYGPCTHYTPNSTATGEPTSLLTKTCLMKDCPGLQS